MVNYIPTIVQKPQFMLTSKHLCGWGEGVMEADTGKPQTYVGKERSYGSWHR